MKFVKLLFDLTATQPNHDGEYHGGGKYGKKIFLSLLEEVHGQANHIFPFYDSTRSLDPLIQHEISRHGLLLLDVKSNSLQEIVKKFAIDRVYSALPFGLIRYGLNELRKGNCDVVGTIHGLRTLEAKMKLKSLRYVSFKEPKVYLKNFAKAIMSNYVSKRDITRYQDLFQYMKLITVSNHTKFSIMSYFPSINVDIPVFYSPDVTEFEEKDLNEHVTRDQGYYLLVSGNRWLKNNLVSVIALDELFSERPYLKRKVIITGVRDGDVYKRVIKNTEQFTFLNYVSESYLRTLYEKAFAFLYMSLNEGFGYPPLEAMKWGVPVITSPFTSIPEVCGDAVLYSNPEAVQEIKNRILQLQDGKIYSELKIKGEMRYKYIRAKQDSDLKAMTSMLLKQ